jgi:hypothetical protein
MNDTIPTNTSDKTKLAADAIGYRRKTIRVVETTAVDIVGTEWSGGSRSFYVAMRLVDGIVDLIRGADAWDRFPVTYTLRPGTVVVRGGTFAGRPGLATVYALPEDAEELRRP